MAQELHAHGINMPDYRAKTQDTAIRAGPEVHHWIAQESDSRIAIYLSEWQYSHPDDPAVKVRWLSNFIVVLLMYSVDLYARSLRASTGTPLGRIGL